MQRVYTGSFTHFDTHTKNRRLGARRLLILDGHESHHSTEFEQYCQEHDIITLCMPAHASHILQPLDVGCFGPLKKAYGKEVSVLMSKYITHITKVEFLACFKIAHYAAMTPSNVRGGFRGAGLVPHDPDAVLSKLDIVRTPSPPRRLQSATPDAWVSQTPSNPTEAVCETSSEGVYDRVPDSRRSGVGAEVGHVIV
jgi:hypothetical protein